MVSGTRGKCVVATTSRVITRAKTTTTTTTTTVESVLSIGTTLASTAVAGPASTVSAVTAKNCVEVTKGKCGSLANKGDGEYILGHI